MFGVHCFAYRTNLAVEPLSNLPIVGKCESLCQNMYAYFSFSPKKHLEFQKLADVVETEGLNMLRNVKTRWILVLEPLKRTLGEYKTLIYKMAEDVAVKDPHLSEKQIASRETARHNLDLLSDVCMLYVLPCLLPLLESVNSLMKFAQARDVFVCDYVAAIKICQAELYMMYCNGDTSFQQEHFSMFVDVVSNHSYTITQEWMMDLNTGSKSLAFRINGHTYAAHSFCPVTGKKEQVAWATFDDILSSIKEQCRDAAEMLITELGKRFPDHELMNVLDIVFPQYWLQYNCDEFFPLHMKTLRQHFCMTRSMRKEDGKESKPKQIQAPLDARTLGFQTSLFKLTMKSHAKVAMEEPRDRNPFTKLWQKVGNNALMLSCLNKFFKVTEIAATTVLGSVEDEWTFSTLGFMKSKLRNQLGGHLDICVKLFSQPFFTLGNFPYGDVIAFWSDDRARQGGDQ